MISFTCHSMGKMVLCNLMVWIFDTSISPFFLRLIFDKSSFRPETTEQTASPESGNLNPKTSGRSWPLAPGRGIRSSKSFWRSTWIYVPVLLFCGAPWSLFLQSRNVTQLPWHHHKTICMKIVSFCLGTVIVKYFVRKIDCTWWF